LGRAAVTLRRASSCFGRPCYGGQHGVFGVCQQEQKYCPLHEQPAKIFPRLCAASRRAKHLAIVQGATRKWNSEPWAVQD
jgi:hypothetical protein